MKSQLEQQTCTHNDSDYWNEPQFLLSVLPFAGDVCFLLSLGLVAAEFA